jgi:hypothetical protein
LLLQPPNHESPSSDARAARCERLVDERREMRKRRAGLILVLVAAAVFAASASGMSSSHASVLHFYEAPGQRVFVDNAPKGRSPSVGDVFVYANPVFTRHGGRVGSDHRVCTVVGPLVMSCTGTLQLPTGQLMLQSLGAAPAGNSEAVVGGTGAFVGARGVLTAHTVGRHTTIDITLG